MAPPSRKKAKAALQPLWESEARITPNIAGRARVLEAAANAFMQRGYAATTLDDVATLLGTTKGQIYHYYRSKLDLYFDVAVGAFFMVHERISPIYDLSDVAAIDRLRRVVHAYALAIMATYPFQRVALETTQFQLISRRSAAQERAQARIVALRTKLEQKVGLLIAEAAEEGGVRVRSIQLAAKAAVGSLTWLVIWFDPTRSTSAETRETIATKMADFVVAGLYQDEMTTSGAPNDGTSASAMS